MGLLPTITQGALAVTLVQAAGSTYDLGQRVVGIILVAVVFVMLFTAVWMIIDAWRNYGPGCGAATGLGCLFAGFSSLEMLAGVGSFLIIIPYAIFRFFIFPPDKYRRWLASKNANTYSPPGVSTPTQGTAQNPQEPAVAPLEADRRLEDMIEKGMTAEALDYAQQMYKMAQDFEDTAGQVRYSKYIERIRRGVK